MIKDEKLQYELNTAYAAYKAMPAWMRTVQTVKVSATPKEKPKTSQEQSKVSKKKEKSAE